MDPTGRSVEAKAGPSAILVLVPPRPVSKDGVMLEAGKTVDVGPITIDVPRPTTSTRTTTPPGPKTAEVSAVQ